MSSNTAAQSKGTPLWRISKKFNFAAEKIIPDSFVFCVILMLVVFVLSLVLCGKGPLDGFGAAVGLFQSVAGLVMVMLANWFAKRYSDGGLV